MNESFTVPIETLVPVVTKQKTMKVKKAKKVKEDKFKEKAKIQLGGMTLDEVYEFVTEKMKLDLKKTRAKYAHLNFGMQRMSLGNIYKGHLKRESNEE